jgi:ribosomal protein L7Ae-like RNA K-turn-binding protein
MPEQVIIGKPPEYNKPLQILGMAKKAGLLAIGSDAVKSAARTGKVKLVAITSDISDGTERQANYSAEDSSAFCVKTPYRKFEFGRVAGRGAPGIVAFLDLGLAAGFMERLAALDKEKYDEIARILKAKTQSADKNQRRRTTNI